MQRGEVEYSTNQGMGRKTQVVDCRAGKGVGLGGGRASKGTFAEAENPDVIVLSMGPGPRHITKPVCEITYGLREAGISTSVMVMEAGIGPPSDAPGGLRMSVSGISPREVAQIARHKLIVMHLGNIPGHFIYKARTFLRDVEKPAIVVCQAPVRSEQFAEIGVKVYGVEVNNLKTKGEVVDIVMGVTRGQTCSAAKLQEIISKVRYWLNYYDKYSPENETIESDACLKIKDF